MYVDLHMHTEYSLLDAMGKCKEIAKRSKELGRTAVAITDHGVMYGAVEFYEECKKIGIKPIIGSEFYVAPGSRFEKEAKKEDKIYYHLILLAKNEEGYKNLCLLTTRANTEGFYYKPRIDFELLHKNHEGLICLSGCIAGEVASMVLDGKEEEANAAAVRYKTLFGDDYYLEIQNHGLREENVAYDGIIRIAQANDIPLVCTNDCHYVYESDAEAHEWMLCMQTKKKLSDPHMVYSGNYSIRPEEEMRNLFPAFQEAFDNTQIIADKCNFEFEFGNYRMPKVVIPESYKEDYFSYLKDEAYAGLDRRYPEGSLRDDAIKKLDYELSVVKQMGFAEYFLDTRKTIMWARSHSILVGPGRGSGAGSVMNYCLGITDIEPIRYGLLFERFLNPERISMPDIDVDYDMSHKAEVVKSEAESNGYGNFSKIATFGTMKAKNAVRDCMRVASFESSEINAFAKLIPNELDITLAAAYDREPEIRAKVAGDERYKKMWEIALRLEGLKKSQGTHACGHIPTPVACENLYPCTTDEDGYLVCQYNMAQAEHLGNLKKDLLMLGNLTTIDIAHRAVKKNKGIDVPLWNETVLNDPAALNLFSTGDTSGIFQFESGGMTSFMKRLKPDCFEDIIAGVSLYRPGPMDYIPNYIENKKNPEGITYLTPELEPILKNTYGVMVYQEQVMQTVQQLAGYTMGRADIVRKAMGKKKKDIMEAEKEVFIYGNDMEIEAAKKEGKKEPAHVPGCVRNGISEDIAKEIWGQMEKFAEYAFNKSHAAAYAAISMQTAYLKAHFPTEFFCGLFCSVVDSLPKLRRYMTEAKRKGIEILPPCVNESEESFSIDQGRIRYGLLAIKGIGEGPVDVILKERSREPFKGLEDFLSRTQLGASVAEKLIKSGSFDFNGFTRHTNLLMAAPTVTRLKKDKKSQVAGQMTLFDMFSDQGTGYDHFMQYPEFEKSKLLDLEMEAMDLYVSGHPLEDYEEFMNMNCTITAADLIENDGLKENSREIVAGIIKEVKKIYTKKNQKQMAFLTIEDLTGNIEAVVFPETFEKSRDLMKENAKIVIKGTVSLPDDEGKNPSIIADHILDLSALPKNLWLKFDNMGDYERKRRDIELLKKSYPGTDSIVIYVASEKQRKSMSFVIDASKAREEAAKIIGIDEAAVAVTYKKIAL